MDEETSQATEWLIPTEMARWRLDRALATLSEDLSRSRAREVVEAGQVSVDGVVMVNPRHCVAMGQRLCADFERPAAVTRQIVPQAMALAIVAETDEYIVVNKPPGLVVHPGHGCEDGTLANGLAAHSQGCSALPRGGIVHRLDKDTSGLLVAAKSARARLSLIDQFRRRDIARTYLAIVHGQPSPTGVVDRPIGRNAINRLKMAVTEAGRPALTRWRLLRTSKAYSLLHCQLESGRTHQIRVHMEKLGHPVAGDRTYRLHARAEGGQFARQMLHAWTLAFSAPQDGELCEYKCMPPVDFVTAQTQLGLLDD